MTQPPNLWPCPNCQTPIPGDSVFCPKCGHKLVGQPAAPVRHWPAAEKKKATPAQTAVGCLVLLALLIGAVWFLGRGDGSGTAGPRSAPTATPVGYVSRAMLGDRWPLTVSDGRLSCLRGGAVFFDAPSGRTYAVNGLAASMFPALDDIEEIWANDPHPDIPKKNIGPLIDRGLALCN